MVSCPVTPAYPCSPSRRSSGHPPWPDLALTAYTLLAPASVAVTLAGVLTPGSHRLAHLALALSTCALIIGYSHLSGPPSADPPVAAATSHPDPPGRTGKLLSALWVAQVLWILPRVAGGLATAGALLALILGSLFLLSLGCDFRLPGRGYRERLDWPLEVAAAGATVGLPFAVLNQSADPGPRLCALALLGLAFGLLVRLRALGARRLALLPPAAEGSPKPSGWWRRPEAGRRWAAVLSGMALGAASLASGLPAVRWAWGLALLGSVLAAVLARLPVERAKPAGRRESRRKRSGSGPHHRLVR